MQLQSGEKSVLAYFGSQADAQSAVQALKNAGEQDVQLDNITPYFKPSSNLSSSISYLTGSRDNPEMYRSYGPLMAAHSDGIGMLSSITDQPHLSYVVTVVTNGSQIETVLQILQSYGATI